MDFEHATRAMNLIERHDPWETVGAMALAIIDETYAAALEIVDGVGAGVAVVEVRAAARAADPDSPVVTVHASATHCCVALNNPRGGDAVALPYLHHTSPKQKPRPRRHPLPRALVSVSPGTLFLSSSSSGDDDVRPSRSSFDAAGAAAGGGVLGILDMIVRRLGEAIRREEAVLIKAMASGFRGPKVDEILTVRDVLDEMRREMDLPALMRRIVHKRRDVTEITCRPAAAAAATEQEQADELTERLMKKLRLKC